MPIRIAIAIFAGAEELDFVGPFEVLRAWSAGWPQDDVEVFTVADTREPITCAKGMRVLADRTWDRSGPIDVLVYPGGRGVRAQLGDAAVRSRLQDLARGSTLMTSVCTGALAFADAGLLKGKTATTHWSAFDELRDIDGSVVLDADARYLDQGSVITAAGVSAGIDMALYLVGRLVSAERSRDVRRYIQYDPEPPY